MFRILYEPNPLSYGVTMKSLLAFVVSLCSLLLLLSCEEPTASEQPYYHEFNSAPFIYSRVSDQDSITKYTVDTLEIDLEEIKGWNGFNAPFCVDTSNIRAFASAGDTIRFKVANVPDSVRFEIYSTEDEGPSDLFVEKELVGIDTIKVDDGHKTFIYKVSSDTAITKCLGLVGYGPGSEAYEILYSGNVYYTFDPVDSLFFKTDSIKWSKKEFGSKRMVQKGILCTMEITGKTNAHRIEILCGGGLLYTVSLPVNDGEFSGTIQVSSNASEGEFASATLFLFGSDNSYETFEISTN